MRKFIAYFFYFADKNLSMKKVLFVFLLIVLIIIGALNLPTEKTDYDYLRLHIRANSNLDIDQNVKYEIKDVLVDYLTPYFCSCKSKQDAVDTVNKMKQEIEKICDLKLQEKGFNYKSNLKVNNEYFPTRSYENVTLESGYYDAVIIELGEACGDNWWCVMYPPLCFVNKNENSLQIKYKSRIKEWFTKLFN